MESIPLSSCPMESDQSGAESDMENESTQQKVSESISALRMHREEDTKGKLYLVTGGSGFLGRHVVNYLRQQKQRVRVLDVRPPTFLEGLDTFLQASVTSYQDVLQACAGVDCVFHIASLTNPWEQPNLYREVNVVGTENVIRACLEQNVTQLIYTSSSSVVLDGSHCQGGDESMQYPPHHLDRYSDSKCKAEQLVLAANGQTTRNDKKLSTCALRPHSIFGPGDTHFIAQLITKAKNGDITHMIGEGTNIADFTYIDNVVYALALAAEKLTDHGTKPAGQVYFVTNGEPTLFWAFIARILGEVGYPGPNRCISFRVAYALAWLMEFFYWLVGWVFGWKPLITRQMVATMGCHHWFSIEKAGRDLNYMPIVTLEDGIKRTAEYFKRPVMPTRTAIQPPLIPPRGYRELKQADEDSNETESTKEGVVQRKRTHKPHTGAGTIETASVDSEDDETQDEVVGDINVIPSQKTLRGTT